MSTVEKIKSIVDASLKKMQENGINMKVPGEIFNEMLDTSFSNDEEWKNWKPINSIIDDLDLTNLETKIGYKLPLSYRFFLKYKHFYRLEITNPQIEFPKNIPDKNLTFLLAHVFEEYPPERLIENGYIYFADFEDHGLLCFDTKHRIKNNEYPIVFVDHDLEDFHEFADNFLALLESDKDAGNQFINKYNTYYK